MAELVTAEKTKSSLVGWAQSFQRLAQQAEEAERAEQGSAKTERSPPGQVSLD